MRTPGKKQSDASSFREVIALAIKREEDAAAGYQDMMKTVRDRGARAFLSELRDEEQMHKKLLQDLSRGRIAEAGGFLTWDSAIFSSTNLRGGTWATRIS